MKIEYTYNSKVLFAQAYGTDAYGEQVYSACEQTADGCVPGSDNSNNGNGNTNTGTEGTPNTGFLGLSPDAAVASFSGVLLVVVAVVGAIYVVARRIRANKKKEQE